jgi:hypothetical protein
MPVSPSPSVARQGGYFGLVATGGCGLSICVPRHGVRVSSTPSVAFVGGHKDLDVAPPWPPCRAGSGSWETLTASTCCSASLTNLRPSNLRSYLGHRWGMVVPGFVGFSYPAMKELYSLRGDMLHLRMTLDFVQQKYHARHAGKCFSSTCMICHSISFADSVLLCWCLASASSCFVSTHSCFVRLGLEFSDALLLRIHPLSVRVAVLKICWLPVYLWAIMSNLRCSVSVGSPVCGGEWFRSRFILTLSPTLHCYELGFLMCSVQCMQ